MGADWRGNAVPLDCEPRWRFGPAGRVSVPTDGRAPLASLSTYNMRPIAENENEIRGHPSRTFN